MQRIAAAVRILGAHIEMPARRAVQLPAVRLRRPAAVMLKARIADQIFALMRISAALCSADIPEHIERIERSAVFIKERLIFDGAAACVLRIRIEFLCRIGRPACAVFVPQPADRLIIAGAAKPR